jgi:hypothetical protein
MVGNPGLVCADGDTDRQRSPLQGPVETIFATLEALFVRPIPLPPPADSEGEDPTPDGLGCRGA